MSRVHMKTLSGITKKSTIPTPVSSSLCVQARGTGSVVQRKCVCFSCIKKNPNITGIIHTMCSWMQVFCVQGLLSNVLNRFLSSWKKIQFFLKGIHSALNNNDTVHQCYITGSAIFIMIIIALSYKKKKQLCRWRRPLSSNNTTPTRSTDWTLLQRRF